LGIGKTYAITYALFNYVFAHDACSPGRCKIRIVFSTETRRKHQVSKIKRETNVDARDALYCERDDVDFECKIRSSKPLLSLGRAQNGTVIYTHLGGGERKKERKKEKEEKKGKRGRESPTLLRWLFSSRWIR